MSGIMNNGTDDEKLSVYLTGLRAFGVLNAREHLDVIVVLLNRWHIDDG